VKQSGSASTRGVPVSLGSEQSSSRAVSGFLVTEIVFRAGADIPRHDHDRATFAVALEGAMDVRLPSRNLACLASSVITEPVGQPHGNRIGSGGCRVVAIQPDGQDMDRLEPFRLLLDRVVHMRHGGVGGLGWRIAGEMATTDAVAPFAIEGLALEMLAVAARTAFGGPALRRPPAWLRRVTDLLHDRFLECPRTDELARAAGVHAVHLARVFRAHMGMPLHDYARRLRLDWAGRRLAESDDPLSLIAAEAGFADQSHFTRLFRRHAGVTPDRYRRRQPRRS
jgi:AraC family transcriptional regulator